MGNVLVTVSDKHTGVDTSSDGEYDYYQADIVSASDYYPFGMQMVGRVSETAKYRYGFNGKEKDPEVMGEGNVISFEQRIFDPRVGRWFSLDPFQKKYPSESHYCFVSNSPIFYKDADGRDKIITITLISKGGEAYQIRVIYKDMFKYYAEQTMNSGMEYAKYDIIENYTIYRENGFDLVTVEKDETNRRDITLYEYSKISDFINTIGDLFSEGDNSDEIGYGYRLYGNGMDMEWQSGLPTAAGGTESIDISRLLAMLELAGAAGGVSSPTDIKEFITNKDIKVFTEKLDNIINAIKAKNEACGGCLEPKEEESKNDKPRAEKNPVQKIDPKTDSKPAAKKLFLDGSNAGKEKGPGQKRVVSPSNSMPDTIYYENKKKN